MHLLAFESGVPALDNRAGRVTWRKRIIITDPVPMNEVSGVRYRPLLVLGLENIGAQRLFDLIQDLPWLAFWMQQITMAAIVFTTPHQLEAGVLLGYGWKV